MIYYLGVCRFADNQGTAPSEVQKIFTVGSDSSFTASEYHNNKEKAMFDYAADAQGRLYFLTGSQTSDSKHQFPFFRGSVYQFTPEMVPKNISYAFTVTAPYKSDFLSDAVTRYEHMYPGKYVKLDCAFDTHDEYCKNGTNYNQRLNTKILSNDVGDVVALGDTNLPYGSALRTDAFLDLTDRIKNDPNAKDLNQSVLNGMKQDGAIRALPVSVRYNALQVNLTLMEKTGVDVTDSNLTWSK